MTKPAKSASPASPATSRETASSNHVADWVVALVAFATAIAGATWWTIDRGQDQNPSWLFSHTASAGTLVKKSDGNYTLTLTGIDPHVMAFTDRPARDSLILSAAQLIEQWPALFADSPPNAVLVEHNPSGNTDSVVLTLSNPRLTTPAPAAATSSSAAATATSAAATATLTFDTALITTEHPANSKRLTRGLHKTPPAAFANASLFIDEVTPWGMGTQNLYCPANLYAPTAGDPAQFNDFTCEFVPIAPAP